jgi:hypothetical protein
MLDPGTSSGSTRGTVQRTKKTDVWNVVPLAAPSASLGIIKWYGAWRRYCFFPAPSTIFEETCLRDIATFCEAGTKAHREAKTKAKT